MNDNNPRSVATVRAAELVGKMTLDEKLSMVITHFPVLSPKAKALGMRLSAGYNPGIPRLGIPPLTETDAGLGVANPLEMRPGDTSTALPASIATAATFDAALAEEGGRMVGAEARAKGFNVLLAGGMNLSRDPWAGRNFEYLGEDALLAGTLAGAAVKGAQSNKIAATLKHFPINPQETGRNIMDVRIDEGALRESDLLAFKIAIERGAPASIMGAYNKVNGHYSCESDLIDRVLKKEWGYPGWVMSDWGAVHSTEKAALAGLDQESGIELDLILNGEVFFTGSLEAAVRDGRVPPARLDEMVQRILVGMIETGALDRPVEDGGVIDLEAHAAVAQRTAEAGCVLLRNEANMLPLDRSIKRIVLIGGHADVGVLSGGGSSQVRSTGGIAVEKAIKSTGAKLISRMTWHASSPLEAVRKLAPDAQVSFVSGDDVAAAANAAAAADVAIVFATQWQSEVIDVPTLSLPDNQDALIEAVAGTNPRCIVVLETGGPVLMPWVNRVKAIVAAWYPGQRGGEAIANILFGKVNPSGRLPITFPAAPGQAPRPQVPGLQFLPEGERHVITGPMPGPAGRAVAKVVMGLVMKLLMRKPSLAKHVLKGPAPFAVEYQEGSNIGYRWYELRQQRPLFSFGHGLSYTSFSYANLEVISGAVPAVAIDVKNSGSIAGADVPQVYVQAADGKGRVTWRLAAFARIELAAGETRRVRIELEPRTYSRWDAASGRWAIDQSTLPVAVGRSASEMVLKATLPVRP